MSSNKYMNDFRQWLVALLIGAAFGCLTVGFMIWVG